MKYNYWKIAAIGMWVLLGLLFLAVITEIRALFAAVELFGVVVALLCVVLVGLDFWIMLKPAEETVKILSEEKETVKQKNDVVAAEPERRDITKPKRTRKPKTFTPPKTL